MSAKKLRIMVLDDEPIVCKRLQPALEKLGYEVDTFTQSLEALHEIQDTVYDIIITDLKMKGIDGMRFLQEAKKQHPTTEVPVSPPWIRPKNPSSMGSSTSSPSPSS